MPGKTAKPKTSTMQKGTEVELHMLNGTKKRCLSAVGFLIYMYNSDINVIISQR